MNRPVQKMVFTDLRTGRSSAEKYEIDIARKVSPSDVFFIVVFLSCCPLSPIFSSVIYTFIYLFFLPIWFIFLLCAISFRFFS